MLHTLTNTIYRVGIFLLAARMLMGLQPSKSYEKYLKFLLSIMVMALFLLPILGEISGGKTDYTAAFEETLIEFEKNMSVNIERETEDMLEHFSVNVLTDALENSAYEVKK